MGFSSSQPSHSPAEFDLLHPEMVAFSFNHCRGGLWCILNKGLSVSPWQLWQGHSGSVGTCRLRSGLMLFPASSGPQKPCASECAMSVWVAEVSYCMWGLVTGLPLKGQGEAGLLFLAMNLEQVIFNTLGPDFLMWAEPRWNKPRWNKTILLFFECKKVSVQTFVFAHLDMKQ